MNEKLVIYDEEKLLEELSNDKTRRSNILIYLNVELQRYQSIAASIKKIREIQEYKIAIVSLESELQELEQERQELIDYLKEK